jgi:hypothetical protein
MGWVCVCGLVRYGAVGYSRVPGRWMCGVGLSEIAEIWAWPFC